MQKFTKKKITEDGKQNPNIYCPDIIFMLRIVKYFSYKLLLFSDNDTYFF